MTLIKYINASIIVCQSRVTYTMIKRLFFWLFVKIEIKSQNYYKSITEPVWLSG